MPTARAATGRRRRRAAAPDARRPARPLAAVGLQPPPLPSFEQWGPVERQPLSHLRRTIAERMALSAALIPHVTHFDRADITELDALIRRNLEPARARGRPADADELPPERGGRWRCATIRSSTPASTPRRAS